MVSPFVVLLCHGDNGLGHQAVYGQSLAYATANLGAADVVAAGVDEGDAGGQGRRVDGRVFSGIDDDGIVAEDVVVAVPPVEDEPVVGSDDECEAVLGMVFGEGLQGVPRVGGSRQTELEVGGLQPGLVLQGGVCHEQSQVVVEQVGGEENYRKALAEQNLSEKDFRRELEKGARVNMLVSQVCAHVQDPTEDEVAAFFEANRATYGKDEKGNAQTLVDVHDRIKDLLRHEVRGRAVEIFVEELREAAAIEYK